MKAPTRIPIRVAIDGRRTALVVGEQWMWLTAEAARTLAAKLTAAVSFAEGGGVEATVDTAEDETENPASS